MARSIMLVALLFAAFAAVAHGQAPTFNSSVNYRYNWTFHTELNTTVPLLKINCTDTVELSIPANQTHNIVWVSPTRNQTTFPSICNSTQVQVLQNTTNFNYTVGVKLQFETTGMYYFLCSVGGANSSAGHCQRGKMALAVNVTGTCNSTNTPPASPSPSRNPPPAPVQIGWAFGVGPTTFNVPCGGSASFNSMGGSHDLVEIAPGGTCATNTPIGSPLQPLTSGAWSKIVTFNTAGTRSFICNVGGHCAQGMFVTVVTGACA